MGQGLGVSVSRVGSQGEGIVVRVQDEFRARALVLRQEG